MEAPERRSLLPPAIRRTVILYSPRLRGLLGSRPVPCGSRIRKRSTRYRWKRLFSVSWWLDVRCVPSPSSISEPAEHQAAKKQKTDASTNILCYVCGANNHKALVCYRKDHEDAGSKEAPFSESQAAKDYAALVPPSKTLSDSYNSKGKVLELATRQKIADRRGEMYKQPVFRCDNSLGTWEESRAKTAKAKADGATRNKSGASAVYCAPCFGKELPTVITKQNELCECVSVATVIKTFTNQVSVSLVPIVPLQVALATTERRGLSAATKADELPVVARLDTGANCHDFISQSVATALIAKGAEVVPTTGRVCSAYRAEGIELSSSVICNYEFAKHTYGQNREQSNSNRS